MFYIAYGLLVALVSSAPAASENADDFHDEQQFVQNCPLQKLQAVIPDIDCPGTPLQCARSARAVAQRQFVKEGYHQGYAWGALAMRINSSISNQTAWSMNAVKPDGWFCTALSKSQIYVVHVFRTGYRHRNSTKDQWTYLAHHRHRTEVCPLAVIKAYIDQQDQPTDAKGFASNLLHYAKTEYLSDQFDHEQWNVIIVMPQGRKLLEHDLDFSFPVYIYDGLAAWCMTSTSNGWLAVVVKIGYADRDEERLSRSRRHIDQNL